MAEFLFITPQELIESTVIGGNVDSDKYKSSIASVQISVIEPLLGSELYDKIKTEAEAESLTGLYLTLYNEYIKPITKNEGAAEYIKLSPYIIANGGIFKHTASDAELPSKQEVSGVAQTYSKIAQMYVIRFNKWITKNKLPEYTHNQDEVTPNKDIILTYGWQI